MCCPVNRVMLLIIDAFDDVSLLAYPGIGKSRVSGGKVFQICLKRADINGGSARNILGKTERGCNFLHGVKPGELTHANAHGVA